MPKKILYFLLYPVILYFFLTDRAARNASIGYLKRIRLAQPSKLHKNIYLDSYVHFYAFGRMMLDTIDAWQNNLSFSKIDWFRHDLVLSRLGVKEGAIVLSAHFGCLEVCRSFQNRRENLKIVPLMYLSNAQKFREFLADLNPESHADYIPIENMNAGVAVEIKTRLEKGEYIAILADRIAPNSPQRTVLVTFLGKEALLPEGPFALAWALGCDVLSVFSNINLQSNRYEVFWDQLPNTKTHDRKQKMHEIKELAQSFASVLEREVLKNPYQWFNFFDFWKK